MGEWQTMDAAPKDGSTVMLFYPAHRRADGYEYKAKVLIGHRNESAWKDGAWEGPYSDGFDCTLGQIAGDDDMLPTHWMPLPAPPLTEER